MFVYTTVANIIERPDGVRIAAVFIVAIVVVSLVSRVRRSFELRASSIELDAVARQFIEADADQFSAVCIIANEPGAGTAAAYQAKGREERRDSGIPARVPTMFLEVLPADSSDFEEDLLVEGHVVHGHRVLKVRSGNVPNTIASTLLAIRDIAGVVRASTSSGTRATRSGTRSGSSSRASVTSPRSRERSSAKPNRT